MTKNKSGRGERKIRKSKRERKRKARGKENGGRIMTKKAKYGRLFPRLKKKKKTKNKGTSLLSTYSTTIWMVAEKFCLSAAADATSAATAAAALAGDEILR